jgi:hypothetical protein
MENDEQPELASRDVRHTHDKLSVGFAVRDELARGTDKQRSSAFEALADEAYEEAMDILDRSPSMLVPIRPCPVVCELTLRHEVQDVQDLCQWVLQAVLKGFEDAGLIEDFDGFLELNSEIHVVPQVGDTNEFRFDFVVERVYETARARLARQRKQRRKGPSPQAPAHGTQVVRTGFLVIGFIIIGTAILAVAGSFLPWAQALGGLLKANGTDGDGIITLVVALIGGALGLGLTFTRKEIIAYWAGLGVFLCGGVIAAVAAYDLNNLTDVIEEVERESELDLGLSAGSGLYLTLVAGIAMALASILAMLTAAYGVGKGE